MTVPGKTRYESGVVVFADRPVACDRARVLIDEAVKIGALS